MSIIVPNQSVPVTPAAGNAEIFSSSGGRLSVVDSLNGTVTLVGTLTTDTLTNKSLTAPTITGSGTITDAMSIVNASDVTKILKPSLGGMTAGVTLTLASNQPTSQTLTIPSITGADTLAALSLAQALSNKTIALSAGTTSVAPINYATTGSLLTSPAIGADEFDGTAFYQTIDTTSGRGFAPITQIFRLGADSGAIGPGIADYFGTTSAFPFVLNGVYLFDFHCYFLKTTAATVTWTLTSTQNYTNLNAFWLGNVITGFAATGATSGAGVSKQTAAATALPVTGTLTTAVDHYYRIWAVVQFATAGNFRLRVTSGSGSVTPRQGSYYTATRLFAGNVGTFVA